MDSSCLPLYCSCPLLLPRSPLRIIFKKQSSRNFLSTLAQNCTVTEIVNIIGRLRTATDNGLCFSYSRRCRNAPPSHGSSTIKSNYHARAELNVITMITFLVSTTATSLDGPKTFNSKRTESPTTTHNEYYQITHPINFNSHCRTHDHACSHLSTFFEFFFLKGLAKK